nr:MAG: hypothetical protein 2 [Aparavirus sp.]
MNTILHKITLLLNFLMMNPDRFEMNYGITGVKKVTTRKSPILRYFLILVLTFPMILIDFQVGCVSLAVLLWVIPQPKAKTQIVVKKHTISVPAVYQFFGIGETKQKLDTLLDNLNTTAVKSNDIAEQVFAVLNPGDTFLDSNISKGLMSLTRIIVNCMMAKDDLKIWNFVFNVSSEFGPAAVKRLTPLFNRNAATLQFSFSDLSSDNLKVFFGEHKVMTRATLAASLAILLQVALGLPHTTSADAVLKFFGDRSRNLNNVVTFGKNSIDIFQGAADYVMDSIIPGYSNTEMEQYVTGYDKWSREVLSLGDLTNPVEVRIQKDKKLVYQIDKLYKQGIEYSMLIRSLRVKPALVEHYQRVFRIIEDYRKKCDYTGVFGNRPRCKPLVVYLFGESGVGKSGMTWPLAADLNALFAADLEQAKDFASEIYFRNVEQEFWDGYHGQAIVVYDDFGQRTDSGSSPNEEYMEVIRTANIAPYPLHMAQIEEKKRTKFVSKAIILTSNILNQQVSSLTFPDAVFRRVDICGKVEVRDEYAKQCWSASQNCMVSRLDRAKCNGPVDTNPYIVTLYDPESKCPLSNPDGTPKQVSYEEFVRMCTDVAERSFEDSMAFNSLLDARMNSERFDQIRGHTKIPTYEMEADVVEDPTFADSARAKLQIDDDSNDNTQEVSRFNAMWNRVVSLPQVFRRENGESTMWNSVASSPRKAYDYLAGFFVSSRDKIRQGTAKYFAVDAENGIYYDSEFSISFQEVKRAMVEKFNDFQKLKNLLFVLGLVLAGIIAYQTLRTKKTERYPDCTGISESPGQILSKARTVMTAPIITEAHTSGDSITRKTPRTVVEAVSSADSTTRVAPRITTEAFTSGDSRTSHMRRAYTEAASSADSVTRSARRVTTEATSSSDSITRRAKTVKTEYFDTVEAEMQAWTDKTAGDLISHRILSNMYKIKSGGTYLLNGLFIRDTVMLAPRHLLPYLKEEVTIVNSLGTEFTVPTASLKMVGISDVAGRDKDAVLIQFPRQVHAHSDIVKHFQTMPETQLRASNVCLPSIRRVADKFLFAILGNTRALFTSVTLSIEDEGKLHDVHIREAIEYNLNTENGDCGAPVIVNETSVLRKIAGIHIAAQLSGACAYGQSITQIDLTRHLEKLPMQPLITDLDNLPNFILAPSVLQVNHEYTAEDLVSLTGLPAPTFGFAGHCSNAPFLPCKTDIEESVIHGYTKTLTKPAYLRRPDVNLLHKNLEKCALNTPYIPEAEVKRAVKEVEAKLLTGESRSRLARVLTFEEAISGSEDSLFISGLNRRTSPGYPWVLQKEFGKVGKTQWLGEDDYVYSDEVRDVVNKRIELAKTGVRSATVWTDTLKDERRPIAKVDALKTRVFSHGPFDYTIAFRMYFLGFIAHIMENRITNEQSIGTNVFAADWARTYKKLVSKGSRVFAGDFSTFDGTLNSCIMNEFADVANKFYNDGPENATIRKVLMLDVFNSIHLCENVFYSCTHSQPSGNPLTTVLNSFYNSVSMRIAFYRVVGNNFSFDDEVSMVSYGDDNVVNISDRVSEYFNQNTCTEAYATFGMIYTDEAKSGEASPDYRKISEVAYLKRGFRLDAYGYVRAPMSLDTLTETPQWIRKTPEFVEACKENVENCIRELAQHPEPIFWEHSEKMCAAFYDATNSYPVVNTYQGYNTIFNDEYYSTR